VARLAPGAPCTPDDDCALGTWCSDGTCQGANVVGVGARCGQAIRCAYGSACVDDLCVRSSELGGACGLASETAAQCDSGYCDADVDDGTCVDLLASGEPCATSSECQTGMCIDDTCSQVPGLCFD
jgi:hypothetical protein